MHALLRPLLTYTHKRFVRIDALAPQLTRRWSLRSPSAAPPQHTSCTRAAGMMSRPDMQTAQLLDAAEDLYGGVIVGADTLPADEHTFSTRLEASLAVRP